MVEEILLQRVSTGDREALGELFDFYRDRLRRMVSVRIDAPLQKRIDSSDVVQDVYLDAQRRLDEFPKANMPLFLWLRLLTGQRLVDLQRFHLAAGKRTARREVSLNPATGPQVNCDSMAIQLVSRLPAASSVARRGERQDAVRAALMEMSDTDREVLSLRHFEGLTNVETAEVLAISVNAASNRYVRALDRLKESLDVSE
jgi:RNA polymerase sigma-70 factor (ECF subfamily)